jgi:hypothetical protein
MSRRFLRVFLAGLFLLSVLTLFLSLSNNSNAQTIRTNFGPEQNCVAQGSQNHPDLIVAFSVPGVSNGINENEDTPERYAQINLCQGTGACGANCQPASAPQFSCPSNKRPCYIQGRCSCVVFPECR